MYASQTILISKVKFCFEFEVSDVWSYSVGGPICTG